MKLTDKIIAITRGGLYPALILSHRYDIRDIDTINVKSYKNNNQEKIQIIDKDFLDIENKNILIVDDICDSGDTLIKVISYLKKFNPRNIKTYSIVVKKNSKFMPDFYHTKTSQKGWVLFEWEKESINIVDSFKILKGN